MIIVGEANDTGIGGIAVRPVFSFDLQFAEFEFILQPGGYGYGYDYDYDNSEAFSLRFYIFILNWYSQKNWEPDSILGQRILL